ncbi:MAG: alpha/beta hydrolase [Bauldia sp.]|uniref:alpha/beta hydrolase family protein n=1 Tax=Bauldia sp. TaxID=2575872 RepID=UPI001DABBF84|nr:alpha/beta hydrolase [Bauldia sp.]MCB1498127.1 alpha/beta hydrolase [Bauldia sp.]
MAGVIPISAGLLAVASTFGAAFGAAPTLAPYKDDLFANQVIETDHGGDYRFIQYDRERDLYGRDEVVEKKAKPEYVSLDPSKTQVDRVLERGGRTVRYEGAGKVSGGAAFVVIFLHGDRGNRHQAMDDWSFGGNFNRLKNLVVRNGGAYLSTDFTNFGRRGADDVLVLMQAVAEVSPGAPIILACSSRGGEVCFRLLEDREGAALVGGMLLLNAGNEESFFELPVYTDPARHIPIFIGHGSSDSLIPWMTQQLFFEQVKQGMPSYPIRFDLFVEGRHGTPLRLTDWRRVLNWMIPLAGEAGATASTVPAAADVPSPVASPRR